MKIKKEMEKRILELVKKEIHKGKRHIKLTRLDTPYSKNKFITYCISSSEEVTK